MSAIRAQVLTVAGRFRDNRKGNIQIEGFSGEGVEIVITQPGAVDFPPTTTRIVLYGESVQAFETAWAEAREIERAEAQERAERWAAS